jgi:multicomponent Na+:H+ antiporter subunit E
MLRSFLLNIFLALVWTFLQGELHASNFAVGMLFGYLVIAVSQRILGGTAYVRKVGQVIGFVFYVLWEIFTASLSLAWIIVHPRLQICPGVVAIPLDAETDVEIATLANLLTLSPGTLSLDVSTDRRTLYVHAMILGDADEFRRQIKDGLERRVLEVLR